jgi:putative addiction module component (TIGR02574 family)
MTKREIIDSVKRLPIEEQVDVALELWDVVEANPDALPLTDAQKGALDERMREADANPQPAEEFDAVKSRLQRGEF